MDTLRKYLLAAVGLAIIASLWWAFRAPPLTVDAIAVAPGPVAETIVEEGKTRVRERYVVAAPITAWSPRLELHPGDAVKAGQVLVELRPVPAAALDPRARAEAEARLARADAAVAGAEQVAEAAAAAAEFAAREAARLHTLADAGTVSASAYDQAHSAHLSARADLASARAGVLVAKHEREAARALLRYAGSPATGGEKLPLAAPVSGSVLAVHHEDEGVLAAAAPIVTLGDPASLEITVEALSADAVRLAPGMRISVERWGGAKALAGRVRRVEPTATTKVSALGVEEQRVLVICDLTAQREEWAALGDAYGVEVRFIVAELADALRVPISALFRDGQGWATFVVRDGRAVRVPVELALQGAEHAAVAAGLVAGELVIVHPDAAVADGVAVEVLLRD